MVPSAATETVICCLLVEIELLCSQLIVLNVRKGRQNRQIECQFFKFPHMAKMAGWGLKTFGLPPSRCQCRSKYLHFLPEIYQCFNIHDRPIIVLSAEPRARAQIFDFF